MPRDEAHTLADELVRTEGEQGDGVQGWQVQG
jgi:hypothetical protein